MGTYKEALKRRDGSFAKTCGYSLIADVSGEHLSKIFNRTSEFREGNIAEDYHVVCELKMAAQQSDSYDTTLCIAENGDACPLMFRTSGEIPTDLIFQAQMVHTLDQMDKRKAAKKSSVFERIKKLLDN